MIPGIIHEHPMMQQEFRMQIDQGHGAASVIYPTQSMHQRALAGWPASLSLGCRGISAKNEFSSQPPFLQFPPRTRLPRYYEQSEKQNTVLVDRSYFSSTQILSSSKTRKGDPKIIAKNSCWNLGGGGDMQTLLPTESEMKNLLDLLRAHCCPQVWVSKQADRLQKQVP